jgi:tetratricopeptide (TPR) repeat protein
LLSSAGELLYLLAATEAPVTAHQASSAAPAGNLTEALAWNTRSLACYSATDIPDAVWLQRADILERMNRQSEAQAAQSRILPGRATTQTDRALAAMQAVVRGDYRGAARLLERLVREAPREFHFWFLAANCHFAQQHYGEAEGCYSACITLRPDSYQAYYQRGVCRLKLARFGDARGDFEQAEKLLPGDLPALVSRALALDGEQRWQEAADDLTQAIDRGFPETRVFFMRESIYRKLGEAELAARDHQEGLNRVPTDPRSWVARGVARIDEDPTGALHDFEKAAELDERTYEAWRNIAHVQSERLDKPGEAIAALDRLLKLTADDPLAWSGRGVLLARQHRSELALADARQALAIRREPLVVYQIACIAALCAGDLDTAVREALPLLAEALAGDASLADVAAADPDLQNLLPAEACQQLLAAARLLMTAGTGQNSSPLVDEDGAQRDTRITPKD